MFIVVMINLSYGNNKDLKEIFESEILVTD